jgi:hypothetical protein
MMRIRTYVGPSKIHGLGCFAAERIKKGFLAWEFDLGLDLAIPVGVESCLHMDARAKIEHYGCLSHGVWYLMCDDARFCNHSSDPVLDECGFTTRELQPGDEITVNYDRDERWLSFVKDRRVDGSRAFREEFMQLPPRECDDGRRDK